MRYLVDSRHGKSYMSSHSPHRPTNQNLTGVNDMVAAVTSPAAKRTRMKKGDGPIVVNFLDEKNQVQKRITPEIDSVQVVNKAGKTVNYSVSALDVKTLRQLAADSLRKRFVSSAINQFKVDSKVDVLSIAHGVYDNIKSGKLYTRGEGAGKPGRQFDYDLWVNSMVRSSQIKHELGMKNKLGQIIKPWGKKQAEDIRAMLELATSEKRKDITTKWMNDATVKRAVMEIKADRARKVVIKDDGYDALSDI